MFLTFINICSINLLNNKKDMIREKMNYDLLIVGAGPSGWPLNLKKCIKIIRITLFALLGF